MAVRYQDLDSLDVRFAQRVARANVLGEWPLIMAGEMGAVNALKVVFRALLCVSCKHS